MLFNSIQFILFFIVVATLYFIIPQKTRWIFLLLASYYFYMCWRVEYIFLIIASTLIDYFAGIMMSSIKEKRKRRKYLILSLCTNLGLLFTFKYFNFFTDSIRVFMGSFGITSQLPVLNVLLPVGISFYTFQTLSYTIDVYLGKKKPEKHFGKFALYVAFFPQLVAGPIERSTRLLPQFNNEVKFDYSRVTNGLKLILWGMFKKVVIADRISFFVDQVYNNVNEYSGLPLIVATIFFAFQIYCDFSGYSDIAIGVAQVLGFKLMTNFNRPYFSKNISEFWKRWHISLSTWFKDYLYIPLGGNRVKKWRWYYNIFIVFLISGLWHGANWTFLLWGALNGLYLLISIWTRNIRGDFIKKIHLDKFPGVLKVLRVGITFSLVCFGWIFFRANSIPDAFYIVTHLFQNLGNAEMIGSVVSGFGYGTNSLLVGVISIGVMEVMHLIQRKASVRQMLTDKPAFLRYIIYAGLIGIVIVLGNFSGVQFIYFQF